MTRKATEPRRLRTPTLTAQDWAEAALQLTAERGLHGLTIDALADRLDVTKGSFYWHFQSRSELLEAALTRWEHRATEETMRGLEAIEDPRRRLEVMLEAASQAPRSRSLYAALAEAVAEPLVAAALQRVASVRIQYLENCYLQLGLSPVRARTHAVLAYAAYRGLLQLAHEACSVLPADWSSYATVVRGALTPPVAQKIAGKKKRGP